MSRLTRREMKKDELVTTLTRFSLMVEEHARSIAIVVGAVLILAVAVTAGILYSSSRERAAMVALARVQKAAGAEVLDSANVATIPGLSTYPTLRAKYEDVSAKAQEVIAEHPSSEAARWATYWKALSEHELGRSAEALATLEEIAPITGEPSFLDFSAELLKARVLEAEGRLPEATDVCMRLVDTAATTIPIELALMEQARLLDAQGREEEALETYRRVTQEYPDSPVAIEASGKLSEAGETPF